MPRIVDADQRRRELTAVTAREIARVGLDRLTLRDVARAAGWTTGIVSHYFADKRDLLLCTFHDQADLAHGRAERLRREGATAIVAVLESVLPLDEERLTAWKVWLSFWGAAVGDGELAAAQHDRQLGFAETIEGALAAEVVAGRLPPGLDLLTEGHRLVALVNGVAGQAVFAPERWPAEEQRRVLAEHLASLAVPSPAPTR